MLQVSNVVSPNSITKPSGQVIQVGTPGVVTVPAVQSQFGSAAPQTITASIAGPTTAATTTTYYLFKNDTLNAVAATAGTGITTYSDGFSGRLYERLITLADAFGPGLAIYGFNITALTTGGIAAPTVFDSANMAVNYYNANGAGYAPLTINLAGAQRNTAYNDGLLTVRTPQDSPIYLTGNCQISITVSTGYNVSLVLFTTPNF